MVNFEITNINKYNLTPKSIENLKVNRDKVNNDYFWWNNVVDMWCLSGSIGSFDIESTYWLGIDKNGKIQLRFDCLGGMCGYNFERFFDPDEIENELDYNIQYKFIEKVNKLIDAGVFEMEAKNG